MARHENPQRPPRVYYPAGEPPRHAMTPPPGAQPPSPQQVEQAAKANQAATAKRPEDLGDVVRAIGEMAGELHEVFFTVPDAMDDSGRVNPESFPAGAQVALVSCGNALDYAIRLFSDIGKDLRITKLRRELAELTGEDGESPR